MYSQFYTMTAVTNQPLPLGHLEREKHIQMIFRAFQNRCGPCECQSHTPAAKAQPVVSEWDPDQQFSVLSPEKKIENRVTLPSQKVEEQNQESSTRSDFMTVLETVSQIHIRAQPELQG